MQRQVKFAKVKFMVKENGKAVSYQSEIVGNNEKEIQRVLNKKYGQNKTFIIDCDWKTKLFVLDDEIFFKYAKEVTDETATGETATGETATDETVTEENVTKESK